MPVGSSVESFLQQVSSEVLAISGVGGRKGPAEVASFCDYAVAMLQAAKPRCINVSFEKDPCINFLRWLLGKRNFAGIGAVVLDAATGQGFVCQGCVPDVLLDKWKVLVGDHLICQIELYVMVLIRWQFRSLLHNRRSIWWVDNDAARLLYNQGPKCEPIHEGFGARVLRCRR